MNDCIAMKEIITKTILVIDDSTTNVVLLEAILQDKGYQIQKALNVKEARMIMQKRLPDLILLDLLMPKINGFDFLSDLKSNENQKNIPVIVISAVTDSENIQKIMNMGAIDYIKKPVDIQSLIDKVQFVLHK